jgi:SynChlorMet cassette protein ScmC
MQPLSYALNFSNGYHYTLRSGVGTDTWLERFAEIMQMKREDEKCGTRHLIILPQSPSQPFSSTEPIMTMPSKELGWESVEFNRILKKWSHPGKREQVYQLLDNPQNPQFKPFLPYCQMQIFLLSLCSDMLESGSLPLHSALISRNNDGIVVSGPSNSGKTTLTKNVEEPWQALSDDCTYISYLGGMQYTAQPLPTWSHYFGDPQSSRYCSFPTSLPLRALYLLEQSSSDGISPVSRNDAAARLYRASECIFSYILEYMSENEVRRMRMLMFNNVWRMVSAVPVFILHASKNGSVWKCIDVSSR